MDHGQELSPVLDWTLNRVQDDNLKETGWSCRARYHRAMTEPSSANPNLPPETELAERFVLAGGPGGQHVNRTETAVQLRFDVANSSFLSSPVKQRLLKLAGQRADSAGVITIEAKRHRSQSRNREDARARLAELIEQARRQPKKRIPTRPTRASKKRRVQQKRQKRELKRSRRRPKLDE